MRKFQYLKDNNLLPDRVSEAVTGKNYQFTREAVERWANQDTATPAKEESVAAHLAFRKKR